MGQPRSCVACSKPAPNLAHACLTEDSTNWSTPTGFLEDGEGIGLLGGVQGFASNQVAAGEVGNRQRIAVAAVGEHELALVVGAPQVIGLFGDRQRSASGFVTPP